VDGLPGSPDNLKPDGKGNIYVPLVMSRDKENTPWPVLRLGEFPAISMFIARLMTITQHAFKLLDAYYPNKYFQTVIHSVGHFEFWKKVIPKNKRLSVLLVTEDGKIVDSFHSLDGSLEGICEVEKVGPYLYLGSPFNKYLARKQFFPVIGTLPPHDSIRDSPNPQPTLN